MKGVQEEIRHVLDSEIVKNGGKLTPQQMYETIKKYETYVACNKRLEGKGTSSSTSQQKATGHTSGYKPWFHKTMTFAATIAESEDDTHCHQESSPQEGADSFGAESSQEDDEGLFIPSYLEEALPDDPTLQVKMARPMQAQEVETRRCFTCNQPGHLQRDHWKYEEKNGTRPLQPKGPPKTSWLKRGQSQNPLSQVEPCPKQILQSEESPYLNPDAFYRFIGPKNLGKALIDDELTTCLLDNGVQLNFITPAYAQE